MEAQEDLPLDAEWRDSLFMDMAGEDQPRQLHLTLLWLADALFYESLGDPGRMLYCCQTAGASIVAWRDAQNIEDRRILEAILDDDRRAIHYAIGRALEADRRHNTALGIDGLLAGAETALRKIWERHGSKETSDG